MAVVVVLFASKDKINMFLKFFPMEWMIREGACGAKKKFQKNIDSILASECNSWYDHSLTHCFFYFQGTVAFKVEGSTCV